MVSATTAAASSGISILCTTPHIIGRGVLGRLCNGAYIFNFNACNGGAMDIDLYNKMDQNDIRRNLYLMPDKLAWVKKSQNKGGITEADFWDASMVGETKALNLAMTDIYVKGDPVARGMYNVATFVCMKYMEDHFKGNLCGVYR